MVEPTTFTTDFFVVEVWVPPRRSSGVNPPEGWWRRVGAFKRASEEKVRGFYEAYAKTNPTEVVRLRVERTHVTYEVLEQQGDAS
jgi:hypothetical protein